MEKRTLTCVTCPRGCTLTATIENGALQSVAGNACKRGEAYAAAELLHPERMLTTTVPLRGRAGMLAVRTRTAIPQPLLMDAMDALRRVAVCPPVAMGDVVLADLLGTGIDVIASASRE